MSLNPYLTLPYFQRQCETAFQFYARCLGGTIDAIIRHAGTPAEQHVSAEWRDKIIHARISMNGAILMGSDAPPDRYQKPQGFRCR